MGFIQKSHDTMTCSQKSQIHVANTMANFHGSMFELKTGTVVGSFQVNTLMDGLFLGLIM